MNDFREFSKAYNDYLCHGLPYAEDYICHFGILGMHWGVRRYQNPDGTLTAAGKKRYDKLNLKANNIKDFDKRWKAREKARKYGTETPEERSEKERISAEKEKIAKSYGYEKGKYGTFNKTHETKDSNGKDIKLNVHIDDHNELTPEFMNMVNDFSKNFSKHDKIMRDHAIRVTSFWVDKNPEEAKKIIEKNNPNGPFIYVNDKNTISADYDMGEDGGWHVNTIEYDPHKKLVIGTSTNG